MKKEKSCGILVFNADTVLMVHHNGGHYSFPKGHVEDNETEYETALREVKEETNCDAKIIDGFREITTYSPKPNVIKDVIFFVGEPITKNTKPQETEVSEARFVPIDEALKLVTYDEDRNILKKAIEFINDRKRNV